MNVGSNQDNCRRLLGLFAFRLRARASATRCRCTAYALRSLSCSFRTGIHGGVMVVVVDNVVVGGVGVWGYQRLLGDMDLSMSI